jgi:hypothetical protein
MAVIAVGDIDRDATVAMIRSHFSSLENRAPERARPTFDVPERPGTRYTIVTDKETTGTAVELTNLRPARNQGTVGGYREITRDQLFSDMLSSASGQTGANPPFLRAPRTRTVSDNGDPGRGGAQGVSNGGVAQGLDAHHRAPARRALRLHGHQLPARKESRMRN